MQKIVNTVLFLTFLLAISIFILLGLFNLRTYNNNVLTTANIDKYVNACAAYAQKNNGFVSNANVNFEQYRNEMKLALNIEDNIESESFMPGGVINKGETMTITVVPKYLKFRAFGVLGKQYNIGKPNVLKIESHHFLRDAYNN